MTYMVVCSRVPVKVPGYFSGECALSECDKSRYGCVCIR